MSAAPDPSDRRVAVMQPYFFPYIGYFQLAACVDEFIFLDDVQYVRRRWMNRNRLDLGDGPTWFTVPVHLPCSRPLIGDVTLDADRFPHWRRKFLRSLVQRYSSASSFREGMNLVEEVLSGGHSTLSGLCRASIEAVLAHVSAKTIFRTASAFGRSPAKGADHILDLCEAAGANSYANLPGGATLYDPAAFARRKLTLTFIEPGVSSLARTSSGGEPLSIIHALMLHDRAALASLLADARVQNAV